MNRRELNINEVKEIQLNILDDVYNFCKSNGIKMYLTAGTLLGAVRHSGYIPWDDDIDIAMLRNDYEMFLEKYSSDDCYLLSTKNPHYPLPIAKVCMNNTQIVEKSAVFNLCNKLDRIGVHIDIFPVDYISGNDKHSQKIIKKAILWRNLLVIKGMPLGTGIYAIKKLIIKAVLLPVPANVIAKHVDKIASQNKYGSMCCSIGWGIGFREAVSSSVYSDSVDALFEGKKYPIPIGWDEWLTNRYGDYMKLPPEDQRVSNHNRKDYKLL